VYLT